MIVRRWNQELAALGAQNDWPGAARERLVPEAWPTIEPSFQIPRGGSIFTIGSCFARNIEEHLARLGFEVPTLAYHGPDDDAAPVRRNHALIKYTPTDIHQEIAWVEAIYARDRRPVPADFEFFLGPARPGYVRDIAVATLSGVSREVTPDHFVQRRHELYRIWEAIFSADCVVMTLGLVEAWFDLERERWLLYPPTFAKGSEEEARYELRILEFQDCLDHLHASLELVRRHNPAVKFLVTTSPVPMHRSFSGEDVLIANTFSKATLRAVCGALSREEGIDYFPSYESVTLTRSWSIWSRDRIHVDDAFVGKIVSRLISSYFGSAEPARVLSQRAATHLAKGDAEAASKLADQATALDPQHAPAWLTAAQACLQLGRHADALERSSRCTVLDASCVAAYRVRVEALLLLQRRDELGEEAGTLLALDAESADAQYLVGRARRMIGDLDAAKAAFEKAARLSRWPFFAIRLAEFLREEGGVQGALQQITELVRRAPANPGARLELIRTLMAIRQLDRAESHAEIAATLPGAQVQQIKALLNEIGELRKSTLDTGRTEGIASTGHR